MAVLVCLMRGNGARAGLRAYFEKAVAQGEHRIPVAR